MTEETERLDANKTVLSNLMDHREVVNRLVVVVSIIGAFRQGKSFFMDLCLRFMYANVSFCCR
jgi:Guanylate-binding protein, N-terminal domain